MAPIAHGNAFRSSEVKNGKAKKTRKNAVASVKAPALGQWHTVRLAALGDHMQAWLDGTLYLDHHDSRFKSGRVGLWTKADSITAFDELTIHAVTGAR